MIGSSQRPLPAQYATLATDIHALGGIRTHDFSKRAAADLINEEEIISVFGTYRETRGAKMIILIVEE